MNSVSEQIDERILRLLGLEDVFDLDYDTYMTLLKEAIVVSRDKIPQEELALLANERKRVRGKKGRFKPKKEKITADKIATTKFLKPTKKTLALPASISSTNIQQQNLSGVGKPLQSIGKTLASILKFNKKTNEEDRREKESQKRTKREESLEGFKKGVSAVSGAAKKMLAPFQSIIDRIWRFIFFTLLGRAFTQLMNWLGDPKNKRKIEVLGRFLKDWWPSLAFAAGLFLTPFGKFVRTTIGLVRAFIPQLIKLTTNPAFLALAGATAAGVAGVSLESNLKKVDEKLLQRRIQESKDKGKPLSQQEIEKIKLEQLQKRIQDVRGTAIPGSALASGGMVPRFNMGGLFDTGYDGIDNKTGQRVSGFGPDTQAIIAQPGEIVMNKKTVDTMGPEYFLGLNRMHGGPGANKPKMGKLYNTGGMIGADVLPGTGTVMAPRTIGNATVAGYQNKFLGIPLGRVNYPKDVSGYGTGYSQQEMRRYEQYNPNKQFANLGGVLPALINRRKDNVVGDAFRNFGTNIKTIKGAAKRREDVMREMGYAPSGYVNLLGQPVRRQGGGLIRMIDNFMFRPNKQSNAVYGGDAARLDAIKKTLPPGSGFTGKYDMFGNPTGLKFGGLVKENTGMNIPGATADRQLTMLQPGEYVLPAGTVSKLGVPLIDMMVAMTDYDSTAAKLGKKPINRPTITPLPRAGMAGMMTLPPITQSTGGSMGSASAAGSKVPSFSAVSPSGGGERSMNASIYGIVG